MKGGELAETDPLARLERDVAASPLCDKLSLGECLPHGLTRGFDLGVHDDHLWSPPRSWLRYGASLGLRQFAKDP
jgi:hypothetical protein